MMNWWKTHFRIYKSSFICETKLFNRFICVVAFSIFRVWIESRLVTLILLLTDLHLLIMELIDVFYVWTNLKMEIEWEYIANVSICFILNVLKQCLKLMVDVRFVFKILDLCSTLEIWITSCKFVKLILIRWLDRMMMTLVISTQFLDLTRISNSKINVTW